MSLADVGMVAESIRIGAGVSHLLLLSDFDGTLCEFDEHPDEVWLQPQRRAALESIASTAGATIGIVSGRRVDDVMKRVGLHAAAYYAGLHGLEIWGPEDRYEHAALHQAQGVLRSLAEAVSNELAEIQGVFLEDKVQSIAVHHRGALPADGVRAEALLTRYARPYLESGVLRILRGACVLELLPNIAWDKGNAVAWIYGRVSRSHTSVWPLYIGDDRTDEDAFRAVRGRGVSVAASTRASGADFTIDGPPDVEALLSLIAEQRLDQSVTLASRTCESPGLQAAIPATRNIV